MSRWTAASDRDYFDEANGPYAGVERTCEHCGRPVLVSRSEPYVLVIWCDDCQRKDVRRDDKRTH